MCLTLKVIGSIPCFCTFFINYVRLMGWWAHMMVDGGGQVHEKNLNVNLNMSLNSGKI
jgi:hypothetical protein